MGNALSYRSSPLCVYNPEKGSTPHYNYGSNQITGWRRTQEDRYVCLPDFYEDLSMFAVYDGHGGEEVVQYLKRFLHQHVISELKKHEDIELALFLGFLTCDNSMCYIVDNELSLIKEDTVREFKIPERAERRRMISKWTHLVSCSAGTSTESSSQVATSSTAEITDKAEPSLPGDDALGDFAYEALKCLEEPLKFLVNDPLAPENDENDEDYIDDDTEDSDEVSLESEDSDEDAVQTDFIMAEEKDDEENNKDSNPSENADNSGSDVNKKMGISSNHSQNLQNEDVLINSKAKPDINEEHHASTTVEFKVKSKEKKPKIGLNTGSTATVVILNSRKLFIGHVGDSRCVACINGKPVPLTVDHRPTDKEEYRRIVNAGSSVSEDGRIEGGLDMSRAFGDFSWKSKDVEEPDQLISVIPNITSIDITADLEFVIVASDGIWNTMRNKDVIHFIKNRLNRMELQDICGELFKEMLPSEITSDGSGCDNMTAVLIVFKNLSSSSIKKKDMFYCEAMDHKESQSQENETTELPSTSEHGMQE